MIKKHSEVATISTLLKPHELAKVLEPNSLSEERVIAPQLKVLNIETEFFTFESNVLQGVGFQNCHMYQSCFDGKKLMGCVFLNCDLSDVSFDDTELQSVYFIDCYITSGTFIRAKLTGCIFKDTHLEYCSFKDGVWKNITFDNCKNHMSPLTNLQHEGTQGWNIISATTSKGEIITLDTSNKRIYHNKIVGNYAQLKERLLKDPPPYVSTEDVKEYIEIMTQLVFRAREEGL